MDIESLRRDVIAWAQSEPALIAVALVGSHARGTANPASDVDLVLVAADPNLFLADTAWAGRFGKVIKYQVEEYGKVTSLRVWYADGGEVEFGLAARDWASLPLDDGTRRVILDGMLVWYERDVLLSRLAGQGTG